MFFFHVRFSQKMSLAFVLMIAVILSLSWLFFETTKRYEYHLKRSELAHGVYESYLAVSNHTFRKLHAMGEIGLRSKVADLEARFINVQSLREAMALVRQHVAAEIAFFSDSETEQELERLSEIERLVELIINASGRIKTAVNAGELEKAQLELSNLHGSEVAGRFHQLIDLALAKQVSIVAETDKAAQDLSAFIAKVLPVVTSLVVLITILGIWFLSRRLTSALSALYKGAQSFGGGDLNYRIDPLVEIEFQQIANAFNAMAKELTANRSALEHARDLLEAKVIERTRALETSNAKLAEADRSRRRLLADISHELRTPLTVIRGESEITLRGKGREAGEYRETLNRILEQAVHTSRLVDDLLFVARADAGQPRLKISSVAMGELAAGICDGFATAAKRKGVLIKEQYGLGNLSLPGDEGRLRQVLAILLDNALAYSEPGGSIELSIENHGEYLKVKVIDDGIGLSREDAEHVFQRFYRGDRAANCTEGSGLGLPVAKAIIDAHKGEIYLKGRPQKGTVATVILPTKGEGEKTLEAINY